MRILLTGSTGFIGNAILQRFDKVKLVLNRRSMLVNKEGIEELKIDFTDEKNIPHLISEIKKFHISHIIHSASTTPWSKADSFSSDNKMAMVLSEICNELKINSFLFLSGWIVYKMDGVAPFSEFETTKPVTEYGMSKLNTETFLKNNLNKTNLYNLRLSSIYGPGQRSPGLIRNICEQAFNNGVIKLDSKNTKRDYLFIDDFLDHLECLLENDNKLIGDINIGSGNSHSVYEIANMIASIIRENFYQEVEIVFKKQIKESDISDNRLSIEKAKEENIIKGTSTSLADGLKSYIFWGRGESIF